MNRKKLKFVGAGPVSAQKGITLIALVITIIVMLILVAVTISMAINGGLFDYAGKAVEETENAINKEQELASGGVTIGNTYYNSIDEYLKGTGNNLPSYDEAEKENDYLTEKAKYTDTEGDTAVIPKGFAISSLTNEQTIEDGLVIKDVNENEFVWIPVEKAIVTEEEIAQIMVEDTSITTSEEAVQKMVDNGTYPMAVEINTKDENGNITETNYKGVLYNFSGTDTLTLTVRDFASEVKGEPVNISTDNTTNLSIWTENLYQESYNSMIKSVAENGGFYVGRYKISLYTDETESTIKYAQSKANQTTLVSTSWFDMYKYEKDYAVYNTNLGVTSEMIWGSQWDQMMIFVNGKNDGTYYVTATTSANVANINNLTNYMGTWTQEVRSYTNRGEILYCRVVRAYDYMNGSASSSWRDSWVYAEISDQLSSRLTLYIK